MLRGVIKNKRGSHVGVIASFGIFILFLVALYFVLEPAIKTQRGKQMALDSLQIDLIEKFSTELTVAIIDPQGNCSAINDSLVGINYPVTEIARDSSGIEVTIADYVDFSNIDVSNNKVWVYFANTSFDSTEFVYPSGCVEPPFESIRKSDEIFSDKIYYAVNNFEDFKSEMNMPAINGFSFSFLLENGTTISAGEKNVSDEVFGNQKRVQYYDEKAISRFGTLGVKVW